MCFLEGSSSAAFAAGLFPGGASGGNYAEFTIEVERIECINHDVLPEVAEGGGQRRGGRVLADHPLCAHHISKP